MDLLADERIKALLMDPLAIEKHQSITLMDMQIYYTHNPKD